MQFYLSAMELDALYSQKIWDFLSFFPPHSLDHGGSLQSAFSQYHFHQN